MKKVSRLFLDNPGAPVTDPLDLEWGYDMPKIRYMAWAETSRWLLMRASIQDAMNEMFMLDTSDGSELRRAAFEMFKASIVYLTFHEVSPYLVQAVGDYLDLLTLEDSIKIGGLVNLLTEREPNPAKIADYMRDNL